MATSFASSSLYVGDLAPDVTEAVLYDAFKAVGPVVSIRVCRDAVTRRSLGYAYVNFSVPNDAERALDTLNYSPIKGRPMRLMWCHHDPTVRKSGVGNIFIKNLDKSIDNKALFDTFSVFGNILSCKVATDETGQSRGFGFVHYETAQAAQLAIEKVNNMLLNNKKVFVGPFIPRSHRPHLDNYTNVYFKNVDETITKENIEQLFAPYGEIKSAVVMTDDNGVSRKFGFVSFDTAESARDAVEKLNGFVLNGRQLYVARAMKKAERLRSLRMQYEQRRLERANQYAGVNLFVKFLDDSIDDDKLRAAFSKFGNITSSKVMTFAADESAVPGAAPVSKGFGFVCFSTPEEATRAVTEVNGQILNVNGQPIGTKPVYVALAQKKEQRRQQLSAQYEQRMANVRAQQTMVPQPGMVPAGYPAPAAGFYGAQPVPQNFYGGPMAPRPRWQNARTGGAPYYAGAPGQVPTPGFRQGRAAPRQQQAPRGAVPQAAQRPAAPQMPAQPVIDASMSEEQQKQAIGNRLYPMILSLLPTQAADVAKVTGMLLEGMSVEDLSGILVSSEALNARVQEALNVLQNTPQ